MENKENQTSDIFVARQPIFKRNRKIYGYELLFRSSLTNFFDPSQDGSQATSKVITNSFLLIGMNKLTEGKRAFINFPEELLCDKSPLLFSKDVAVVEILEDVNPTDEVVNACKEIRENGYILALDDFIGNPGYEPLLEIADIIKIDIYGMDRTKLNNIVHNLARYDAKLLAEKVETNEEFELCKKLGFYYFQGYFFSKPKVVSGKDIPGSKLHYFQIIKQIQDVNYNFISLANTLSHDVSLSYKLLKYVNSAGFGAGKKIESLERAISMMGEKSLRNWLSLMMLSYLAHDKPNEVLKLSIFRAHFCEMLGQLCQAGREFSGECFTVGMFSFLDAMLDKPMEEILSELSLSEHINDALLKKGKGNHRIILALVEKYEKGNWKHVAQLAKAAKLSADSLPPFYDAAWTMVQQYDV